MFGGSLRQKLCSSLFVVPSGHEVGGAGAAPLAPLPPASPTVLGAPVVPPSPSFFLSQAPTASASSATVPSVHIFIIGSLLVSTSSAGPKQPTCQCVGYVDSRDFPGLRGFR